MIGANTLLYMNQSTPTMGVALNSYTEVSTNFALRLQSSTPLCMDCSKAVFIDKEHLVATLKNGDIYLLTLVPDGMKGVRNVIFEKTAVAVLGSCVSEAYELIRCMYMYITMHIDLYIHVHVC